MRKGFLAAVAAIGLGVFGMGVANAATPQQQTFQFSFVGCSPAGVSQTAAPGVTGLLTGATVSLYTPSGSANYTGQLDVDGNKIVQVGQGETQASAPIGFPGFTLVGANYVPLGKQILPTTVLTMSSVCNPANPNYSGNALITYVPN